MVATDDLMSPSKDADVCLLVGARPRTKGMERADLLTANGAIFTVQGEKQLPKTRRDVKVLVIWQPMQYQCRIAAAAAKKSWPHQPKQLPWHAP